MEYMDLDEFLSENGIPIGEGLARSPPSKGLTPPRSVASADGSSGSGLSRGTLALAHNTDSSDSSKPGSSASTRYPDSPINYQWWVLIVNVIRNDCDDFFHCHFISSPANNLNDDECSNASESSNSSALESITPSTLEETTPPVGRRKRTAVSISSSVNGNTSDDGIVTSKWIKPVKHLLATQWLFSKQVLMYLDRILIRKVANFPQKNYAPSLCLKSRRNR